MSVAEIPLTRNLCALIDAKDLPLVADIRWHARPRQSSLGGFYAVNGRGGARPTKHGCRYMHRLIIGAADHQFVDHINGNGLDNRRCNLRVADLWQNNVNRDSISASGYRGVYPERNRFVVRLRARKKRIWGGTFECPVEAARAYDKLALVHHGEFARLNFGEAA